MGRIFLRAFSSLEKSKGSRPSMELFSAYIFLRDYHLYRFSSYAHFTSEFCCQFSTASAPVFIAVLFEANIQYIFLQMDEDIHYKLEKSGQSTCCSD